MLKKTAVDFFVKPGIVATKLCMTRQGFWLLGKTLPWSYAERLEKMTNGAIKLDKRLYIMQEGRMIPKDRKSLPF